MVFNVNIDHEDVSDGPCVRNRDGLITGIPSWDSMTYHSVRWESLCSDIVDNLGAGGRHGQLQQRHPFYHDESGEE